MASGSHVRADRILGRENLSLVSDNNCFGIFLRKDDKTIRAGSIGRNEKQRIIIDATGGTFTLTFGGQTTSALAFDVTAAGVQTALRALSSIGDGNVTVTGNINSKSGAIVEFTGTLANADQAQITATSSLTKGSSSSAGGAGNRKFYIYQQSPSVFNGDGDAAPNQIRFSRSGSPNGGTFYIELGFCFGHNFESLANPDVNKPWTYQKGICKIRTAELPYDATAGQIVEALNDAVAGGAYRAYACGIEGACNNDDLAVHYAGTDAIKPWDDLLEAVYFYTPAFTGTAEGGNEFNYYHFYPDQYELTDGSVGGAGWPYRSSPDYPIHGRVRGDGSAGGDGLAGLYAGEQDLVIMWNAGWRQDVYIIEHWPEASPSDLDYGFAPIRGVNDDNVTGGGYSVYQPQGPTSGSSGKGGPQAVRGGSKYNEGNTGASPFIEGAVNDYWKLADATDVREYPSGHPVQIAVYDVQFSGVVYDKGTADFTNGVPTATITTIDGMNSDNTATWQAAFDAALGAGKVSISGAQYLTYGNQGQTHNNTRFETYADGYGHNTTKEAGAAANPPLIDYDGPINFDQGHDKMAYGGLEIEFLGEDMQNKWINVYYPKDLSIYGNRVTHGPSFDGKKTTYLRSIANQYPWRKSLLNVGAGGTSSASVSVSTSQAGSEDITGEVLTTAAMFVAEEADITPNPIGPNGTVAGITDVNFIGGSGADDNDYVVTYSSLTSGVVVGQRLITRSSNKTQSNELDNLTGFSVDFIDTKDTPSPTTGQSKDRLSIAGYDNNPFALNAMTIMKSNFPGLVGISNIPDVAADVLPETIFNIQATGNATVRVTAGHGDDSAVQILAGENTDCDNGNPHNGFETVYTASGDYKFTDFNTYEDCNKCTAMRIHGCKVGVGLPSGHLPEYTFHIAGAAPKLGLQTTASTRKGYIYSKATTETLANGTTRTCDHLWWSSNCGDVQLSTQRTQDHVNISSLNDRLGLLGGGETAMDGAGLGDMWDGSNPYGGEATSDIYMGDDYTDLAGNSMGEMAGLGRDNFGGATDITAFDDGAFDNMMGIIDGLDGATNNTGQGFGAAAGLTTGSSNTAIGAAAGAGTSTGSCNTFVGVNAGRNVTTGQRNVAVGCEALYPSHADVDYNIFVGTKLPQTADNDWVLQIGHGPNVPGSLVPGPILSGSLGPAVANKQLFVLNKLTVPNIPNTDAISFDHDQNLFGTDKVASIIQKDDNSSDYPDGGVAFRFKGANGVNNDLMTLRHHVEAMSRISSYNTPAPERPVVEIKGDLNVLGAIRFHDGTSMESGVGVSILPGSGLDSFLNSNGETEFKLDVEDLPTAPILSNSGSYVAIGTSGVTQRISLQELDYQLNSGTSYILANHNHALTVTSDINPHINSYTNLMGYRAGDDIIQSNYSVFIGPEAGANDGLAVSGSYSSAFIGHRAGMNAGSADNSVFIGPNAGHYASGSRMSVFIGNSAGLNAKSSRSVGLGDNALEAVSGDRNIEITVGMGGADPYRLITGTTSNKLNVGDMIGGDMSTKRLSVGNAILSPSGTFDVRAPSSGVGTLAPHVQTWWNHNGAMVAYLDHDGNMFIKGTVQTLS